MVEEEPSAVSAPLAKPVVNCFPRGKAFGQQAPGTTALDEIENGIEQRPQRGGWSAHALGRREEGFDQSPLFFSEIGVVGRNLHRPDSAARESGQFFRKLVSRHNSRIIHFCYHRNDQKGTDWIFGNLTFQTVSKASSIAD